jgi:hypothetical protein
MYHSRVEGFCLRCSHAFSPALPVSLADIRLKMPSIPLLASFSNVDNLSRVVGREALNIVSLEVLGHCSSGVSQSWLTG